MNPKYHEREAVTAHLRVAGVKRLFALLLSVAVFSSEAAAQQGVSGAAKTGELTLTAEGSAAGAAPAVQAWNVSVARDDGGPAINGRVTVPSAGDPKAALSSAKLSWSVDGAKIAGGVRDEQGQELATFEGTATSTTAVSGTFTSKDGSSGSWSFEGSAAP